MRNITTVTNQILTILKNASIAPADQDNTITLQAELRIILRRAAYSAPESSEMLWQSLSTSLYRYLPPVQPTGYTAKISELIQG